MGITKRKKKEFVNNCLQRMVNDADKLNYFSSIYIVEVENEKYIMDLEEIMNYFIDLYCESLPDYWCEFEHDRREFENFFNYFSWGFEFVNSCIVNMVIDNTKNKFNKNKYPLLKSFKPDINSILMILGTGCDSSDNVVFVNSDSAHGLYYLHVSGFLLMLGNYEIVSEYIDNEFSNETECLDYEEIEENTHIMITDLPMSVFKEFIHSSCTNEYVEWTENN